MASTYTNSNGIEKIVTGEQSDNWGNTLDNNFDLIDQTCDGVALIALSSNAFTLAVTNGQLSSGRNKVIAFSGSPSSIVTVTITPSNITKIFWITNGSTQNIVLSNGSGSTITCVSGTLLPCYCDGLGNIISLQPNELTNLTVTNNMSVVNTLQVGTVDILNALTIPNPQNISFGSGWLPWTPIPYAGGSMVISSFAINQANYLRVGPVVFFEMWITFTTSGTANAFVSVSQPPPTQVGSAVGLNASNQNTGNCHACYLSGGNIVIMAPGGPWTLGAQAIFVSGHYRCA